MLASHVHRRLYRRVGEGIKWELRDREKREEGKEGRFRLTKEETDYLVVLQSLTGKGHTHTLTDRGGKHNSHALTDRKGRKV